MTHRRRKPQPPRIIRPAGLRIVRKLPKTTPREWRGEERGK